MVVGGLMLFISGSWIGYIGAVMAVIGAVMVGFVLYRTTFRK
jgi:hypothetical protein